MRLAFCLFRYFPYGGLQRDFVRIAQACRARGHSIDVYTLRWEGETLAELEAIGRFRQAPSPENGGDNRCQQVIDLLRHGHGSPVQSEADADQAWAKEAPNPCSMRASVASDSGLPPPAPLMRLDSSPLISPPASPTSGAEPVSAPTGVFP